MKVLVIGGTGTIGLGIVKESIKRGYETYTISRGRNNDRLPKECIILKGDIKQIEDIQKLIKNLYFDVIFDGLVFRLPNLKNSIKMYANKCKHYIFVSTTGVYARKEKNVFLKEDSELGRIEWEYNKGKIECEEFLNKNKDELTFKYTIVRPSVTYGDRRIPYTIVDRNKQWSLIERIINDKPIVTGPNVRCSICHLEDFSSAVVSLFMNKQAFGESFHVAGKDVVYWDDIIHELEKKCKHKAKIIHIDIELMKIYFPELYLEMKYNKSDDLLLSNEKIETVINGFKSKISINEGIDRTYKTLKEEQEKMLYDDEWNSKIDMLIYISYKKEKFISDKEKEYAKEYINTIDIIKLRKKISKINLRYPFIKFKSISKRFLHKFL